MKNNDYKIVFKMTDSGARVRRFVISPTGEGHLVEGGLEGFDCAVFDVKLAPYAISAGGYPTVRRFAQRELRLTFELDGGAKLSNDNAQKLKRKLISMMDPAADCTLEIDMYGVKRKIGVIPYGECAFTEDSLSSPIEATLSFISPAVFFEDSISKTTQFRDRLPLFTFPLNLISGVGNTSGIYKAGGSTRINNEGDGCCGIIVTLKASGGSIVHPGIECGGKYIRCPMTLEDGHVLTIDTRDKLKNITVDGERYFTFDRGSTFFSLPSGESVVSVTCDSGSEFIDAQAEYTPVYYGL